MNLYCFTCQFLNCQQYILFLLKDNKRHKKYLFYKSTTKIEQINKKWSNKTKKNQNQRPHLLLKPRASSWKFATTMVSCQLALMILKNTSNILKIILANAPGGMAIKQSWLA